MQVTVVYGENPCENHHLQILVYSLVLLEPLGYKYDIHASRQTFVSSISSSSSSSGGTGLLNEALKRKHQSAIEIHKSNVGNTDAWVPLAEEH